MTDLDPPKMFQHALALYGELSVAADAKHDPPKFVGSMVEAFRAIKVSQGYYSALYSILKELGCIEVTHLGIGGGRQSEILLYHAPELAEFKIARRDRLTKTSALGIMHQRVSNIERRMTDLDLAAWVQATEQRLHSLEDQLLSLREERQIGASQEST